MNDILTWLLYATMEGAVDADTKRKRLLGLEKTEPPKPCLNPDCNKPRKQGYCCCSKECLLVVRKLNKEMETK